MSTADSQKIFVLLQVKASYKLNKELKKAAKKPAAKKPAVKKATTKKVKST